jgi:hypothetical protein
MIMKQIQEGGSTSLTQKEKKMEQEECSRFTSASKMR